MKNYSVIKKFQNAARLWVEHEKTPHDFGNGQIVYHSEVFLLIHIEKHRKSSVIELAKILNITKGSVSEVLKKLEKKDLIIKESSLDNASKVMIDISPKGIELLKKHDKIHLNIEVGFKEYYESLSDEKLVVLEEFFTKCEDFLNEIKDKNLNKIINS